MNYGAIWHRFGFQQLAGVVAGRGAGEKTTGLPHVGDRRSSTSSSPFLLPLRYNGDITNTIYNNISDLLLNPLS